MSDGTHATVPTGEGEGEGLGSVTLAPGVTVPAGVVRFEFARSSGPGGQNVNKRSTKAELRVSPRALPLSAGALARLVEGARGYVTDAGELLIVCDEHRSQGQNKAACLERLRGLIVAAQAVPKRRIKTRPSRGSNERRLEAKKNRAGHKRGRGRAGGEE
jgi:ribosome-associated protein